MITLDSLLSLCIHALLGTSLIGAVATLLAMLAAPAAQDRFPARFAGIDEPGLRHSLAFESTLQVPELPANDERDGSTRKAA